MARITFFHNPMSRGQIARWALEETGADYSVVHVDWADKPPELLAANPMGKLPTIIHHAPDGDRVVTEAAAICHYLAEIHPQAGLLPTESEKADYFRWMFFAAGPVEQAITSRAMGFAPTAEQEMMAGFGNFDRTVSTLDAWVSGRDYICGDRFTMADVYVGSSVDWGLAFGIIPERDGLVGYAKRIQARDAYRRGKQKDGMEVAQ